MDLDCASFFSDPFYLMTVESLFVICILMFSALRCIPGTIPNFEQYGNVNFFSIFWHDMCGEGLQVKRFITFF